MFNQTAFGRASQRRLDVAGWEGKKRQAYLCIWITISRDHDVAVVVVVFSLAVKLGRGMTLRYLERRKAI